jgi:hypothetical protein
MAPDFPESHNYNHHQLEYLQILILRGSRTNSALDGGFENLLCVAMVCRLLKSFLHYTDRLLKRNRP